MEEINKKLYPIKFLEDTAEMPWGFVTYQIADLGFIDSMVSEGWFGGNTLSELMGTYMERVVGDDAFEYYGLQFPLLVKTMKTTGRQPLQINVGDEAAEERYDSFGKKSFWYILEASEDAFIYLGLDRDVEPAEFYNRCQDGTLDTVLKKVHPKAGDSFIINPGTVFAAGPGLAILEIGECSELAFNLETELEEVFDLVDFNRYSCQSEDVGPKGPLAECEEFKITRFDMKDPLHIFSDQPGSFAIYFCLSGEALVQAPNESSGFDAFDLKAGHSVLMPSEVNDYMLFPAREGTVILEALVERRVPKDSYTGDSPEEDTPDPHVRNWN